jgi:putative ABC transport system permease protein
MSVLQDIRLALRLFTRAPGPTSIALASTALSIAATAVVFTAIKSVLIDPLPYARPAGLVQLRSEYPRLQEQSLGDWVDWNDARELIRRTRTLEGIGVYRNAVFNVKGDAGGPPEALYGLMVTAALFPSLGVSPMLGRNIAPDEEQPGHDAEIILSYGLWVRRFHADRVVVGRDLSVDGRAYRVIGVMPPQFNFPLRRAAVRTPAPYVEFWAPLPDRPGPHGGGMGAIARLRPGVSLAEARQELAAISDALQKEFPAINRDRVLRLNFVADRLLGGARGGLWMLFLAAVLFLLIGCSNVANLLLARGLARSQEFAVRLALGGRRARIVRQLLTESCLLALAGGLAGYALTAAAWAALPKIAPVSIPRLAAARADGSIFAFALALSLVNGILFGMAPSLRLSRAAPSLHLSSGLDTRGELGGRDRLRSLLVAAEIAFSVVLVALGGQLLGSFARLIATDPGFHADHVLASVLLPAPERYPGAAERSLFYRRVLDAARALPGVESAGTVDALPFSGENDGGFLSATSDAAAPGITAEIDTVGGDYLQTLGIRLLEGRWFLPEEIAASNDSAIVSRDVAARLWPGDIAIGKRICVFCTPDAPPAWKRVVGVVAGANHARLGPVEISSVYLSANAMQRAQFLVVRTQRPSGEMAQAIRRAIAALDPEQPVLLSASMRELISDSVADRRFIMLLLAALGALALATAAAGVYGVASYTTSRRTREIGLRMAVGATPARVVSLIFRQSLYAVTVGIAAGASVAWLSMRALSSTLPGLEGGHPAYLWIASAVVSLAAALACCLPALRATRIDPVSALRQE